MTTAPAPTCTPTSNRSQLPLALVGGATTAAWTAIPEWLDRRWQRVAARAVVLGSSLVGSLYLGADEPLPDTERDERMAQVSRAMEHPATRVAIIGAVLGVMVLAHRAENRVVEAGTTYLADRGLTHPRTAWGLVLGAAIAGLDVLANDSRRN
ncbi:hypothetical protein [Gephyromycinifex aptenodytis]|uniref:hypothetical protein n=1 Tax=Gephyromycinifex aptenodytis TaxID=2716227 RepID=UPI001446716D|nr:hypothetical protein [Gephyromycinifex aptenodytis]